MNPAPDKHPRRRGLTVLLVLVLASAAGAAYMGIDRASADDTTTSQATFAAIRGELMISVADSGTIQAKDQIVITNKVERSVTIIELVEEGTHVEEGDLLVELDSAELQEKLVDREIDVQNAEATFINARENLEIVKSQATSDIAQAELDHRFAVEDLKNYEDGDYPRLVKEAKAKITLALEDLENSSETLRWSERLFAEKYISQTELDGDRLAKNRADLEHQLAVDALSLLEKFTYKRQVDALTADAEQNEASLERVKRKAAANIVQAEADLRANQSEFEREQTRLLQTKEQIAACRIVAPRAGMVIYATTGRGSWRRDDEPLEEGQQVRERQELIHLPTTNSMMAEVLIHESSLKKVKPDQRVEITIDALAGRSFQGTVVKISPLPSGRSSWLNPNLKEYPAEIHLDGAMDGVRTGMSCNADIIVAELDDVVYVPVQAVVRVGEQPTVYVLESDGTFAPRAVKTGLDNGRMIHVESGLQEGERVSLSPPLKDAVRERRDSQPSPETGSEPSGSPRTKSPNRSGKGGGREGRGPGSRGGRPAGGTPAGTDGPTGRSPKGNRGGRPDATPGSNSGSGRPGS